MAISDNDLKKIGTLMDDKLSISEQRILGEIGKFVEDELLPAIDARAAKTDIDRLERKIDIISAKAADHSKRLADI